MSFPITDFTVAEARKAKLLEGLPASHQPLGSTLSHEDLAEFVRRVNEPEVTMATPDEIREGVRKHGSRWIEENKHRMMGTPQRR